MTTKQAHTAEPWRLDQLSEYDIGIRADRHGIVATVFSGFAHESGQAAQLANAARIVQCVNAMAGILDPEGAVKMVREALTVALDEIDDNIRHLASDEDEQGWLCRFCDVQVTINSAPGPDLVEHEDDCSLAEARIALAALRGDGVGDE